MAKGDLISRSELLKEFDPNGERLDPIYVRGRIVQANGVSETEIRNKVIEEFAEAIKTSQDALMWSCRDLALEFCNGDECEECLEKFKVRIDEIAESMKGEK